MRFTADLDRGICSFLVIVALSSGALGFGTGSAEALPVDSASTLQVGSAESAEVSRRIGASAVARAVIKAWSRIPAPVRKTVEKYAGAGGFFAALNRFTGTEEHVIYSACRAVGMGEPVARWVTKIILLFI